MAILRQKGIYRNLLTGDLTANLDIADATYDAMISVGIFSNGHVGPENLDELIRTIKPNGLIVLSMNALRYAEHDYPSHIARLEAKGAWRVLKSESSNYMTELNRPGMLIVARRGSA